MAGYLKRFILAQRVRDVLIVCDKAGNIRQSLEETVKESGCSYRSTTWEELAGGVPEGLQSESMAQARKRRASRPKFDLVIVRIDSQRAKDDRSMNTAADCIRTGGWLIVESVYYELRAAQPAQLRSRWRRSGGLKAFERSVLQDPLFYTCRIRRRRGFAKRLMSPLTSAEFTLERRLGEVVNRAYEDPGYRRLLLGKVFPMAAITAGTMEQMIVIESQTIEPLVFDKSRAITLPCDPSEWDDR
jgi:hypothetical protein